MPWINSIELKRIDDARRMQRCRQDGLTSDH